MMIPQTSHIYTHTFTCYFLKKIFQYKEFSKPIEDDPAGYGLVALPKKFNKGNTASRIRLKHFDKILVNGGWHFSWLGGAEKIKYKLESFAHQEWNNEEINNLEHIRDCLKNQKWVASEDYSYEKVEIDNTYPKYLLDNIDKFKAHIL